MSYLLLAFLINSVFSFNFSYSAILKPRLSADYIGMKISVLLPTQLVFTVIELTILQRNLHIST